MAKSPNRDREVFFVGAGFSRAFGLPNTAELLTAVHQLSDGNDHWGVSQKISQRLHEAYQYFYPDEGVNFQPPVGDFFTVLATYEEVAGTGLPGGFGDSALLDDLRFAIASILCTRLKSIDESLSEPHDFLDQIVQRGQVIITSNWDYLIERACIRRNVPFRLRWYADDNALTILKLHGSVDWTERGSHKGTWSKQSFHRLANLTNVTRERRDSLKDDKVARCNAIDLWSRAYQRIRASSSRPFMVTMARGKSEPIAPLLELWTDAYHVLSRARNITIAGYSMPDDDVEIRTLLRAGVRRGQTEPSITVINPAPDVHVRVRQQVASRISSDYTAVAGV